MRLQRAAVARRPFDEPSAIGARRDELRRRRIDGRDDDDDVADEPVRNGARLERRLADLDVRRRLQLLDQRGFTQQRFELGADLLPLRGGNPRERRFQTAPSPQREVGAQPASQPIRLAHVDGAAVLVAEHVNARRVRSAPGDPFTGPPPRVPAVFDDQRLRYQAPGQLRRRVPDPEHFGRKPLMIRSRTHLRQPSEQSIPEHRFRLRSIVPFGNPESRVPKTNAITIVIVSGRSDIEHKAQAPQSVSCFIITVSDTRSEATDTSGRAIAELLTAAGHEVAGRTIVRDDPSLVRSTIERQLAYKGAQVIITTGGTGITSRDSTIEAVDALLEKRLEGFGELFRSLSYQQIGAAAMMTRATAGLAAGRIVVSLPGSEAAVRLAMEKLLLPELGHLVQQAGK